MNAESKERLRSAFDRAERVLGSGPDRASRTASTRVRVMEGLKCEVQDGPWTLTADLDEKSGGGNEAPSPGVYGRAALGSCMAMTYALWAAKLGVELESIEVVVDADFDAGALYGIGNAPPGYTGVRCSVHVRTRASEDEVHRVLDEADRHSPYVDVFSRDQCVTRSVTIGTPGTRDG